MQLKHFYLLLQYIPIELKSYKRLAVLNLSLSAFQTLPATSIIL